MSLSEPSIAGAEPSPQRGSSALSRYWRGSPGLAFRLGIAVLPLLWLSKRVTFDEIANHALAVGLRITALAIVTAGLSVLPSVVRWRILLVSYGAETTPALRTLLRHLLVCVYYNALPSGVAGDFIRAHRVRSHLPTPAASYAVVFVERITGLIGLLLLAVLAALIGGDSGIDRSFLLTAFALTVALALSASAALFVVPYARDRFPALAGFVSRIPGLGKLVLGIPKPLSMTGLGKAVALSLLTQGFAIASLILLTRPLVEDAQLIACIQLMPLAILLTYLPITPGGIAQREAIFAYLFAFAGVEAGVAVAVSLLFFAAQMAIAACGGLVHLAERIFGER